MNAIKDLKLDDVFDDLRAQASKRIEDLLADGRKQARKAGGGHDDAALFSALTLGVVVGVIVGAAIALVMTPFSGQQARAKLSERVDKLRSDNDTPTWEPPSASGNGTAAGSYEPSYTPPKPVS
ncbi:MAG TPA: hypothetical protein VGT60_13365 [Candidatus Limnocylindria bacterium]|nr:hypothetical protein [Candidatus Limnocylindria bacterium]